MSNKRIVILDTHAILHRAYHALPDFASSKGEPTGALYGLVSMLVRIATDLAPDYVVAAFDLPDPTHRHLAYEGYKAQRKETDDGLVAQIIRSREVLEAFGIPLYEKAGFEADDCIGTIVETLRDSRDLDIIIASGDMDMLQLVDDDHVRVFTFKKGLSDVVLYNEAAVVERFGFGPKLIPDLKGIMGDPSDNIKGVPGVGEGSALKLIKTYGSVADIYTALHKDGVEVVAKTAGIQKRYAQLMLDAEEDAKFSRDLAEIHRSAPIHFSLPKREWKENIDIDKLFALVAEFEFRSLTPRIKTLLGVSGPSGADALPFAEEEVEAVDAKELEQAALAVYVLDSNVTNPTLEDVYRVGRAKNFEDAYKNLRADIAANDLSFVYENIELPLIPVLRRMEERGIRVDTTFLSSLAHEYRTELEKLAARIYDAAGSAFNINSPKQLGEVLFDTLGLAAKNQKKTATGQRSTRESELEKMKDLHPIIADILSYRELQKLLSTYIDTIPTLLDEESRLHTTFVQTGTSTGRLASQNPNLQNIPIKTELGRAIRRGFIAAEGMELVSFDYSQIELRIAAFLSGDESLSDIFKREGDVHREVASRVFHVSPEEVTYEQRRRAKVINFGILYGMGVNALKDALGSSRTEAQEFYNEYFNAFPRLAAYLEETKADASRLGYTKTHFGRRRYFDGITSQIQYVRASAERMAVNAPLQGTQADIVKLAMIRIDELLEKKGMRGRAYMLLQVHDELVFEIESSLVEELAPEIRACMEQVIPPSESNGIPFSAKGARGPSWGEMEEMSL